MKNKVDEILLGYDIRYGAEYYVSSKWTSSTRKIHLLKPNTIWPVTIDVTMWPSVFDAYGEYDDALKLKKIYFVPDYDDYVHDTLRLWQDLEAMKTYYQQKQESMEHSVLIAIVLKEEEWYLKKVLQKSEEERYASVATASKFVPKNVDFSSWETLGFDVCDMFMLSGLVNCGYQDFELTSLQNKFAKKLNEYGLFCDWNDAVEFKEMNNERVSEHAPFLVYKLYRDPTFTG